MTIEKDISLKDRLTFRIEARARYFCTVENIEDLKEAVQFCNDNSLPVFVLGGGSNSLFVNDFEGMVIFMAIKGVAFEEGPVVRVRVGAGENWDELVATAVSKGYWGIENLSYIPGSLGAAPVQNIGAYGVELNQVLESVEVFDTEAMEIKILSNTECGFSYRTSIFKTDGGKKYIVTAVTLQLKKESTPTLSYTDVANFFSEKGTEQTIQNVRNAVIEIRKRKLPDIKDVGTAGSFFKNPTVEKFIFDELESRFPGIQGTRVSDGLVKVSAAWMLDHIGGFKGIRERDAGVWPNQALALVNFGNASGAEILALAERMKEKIKIETGIELEKEVVIV